MHHFRSYGGWSWAMAPYYNENVTQYFNDPRAQEIFEYIGIDYMCELTENDSVVNSNLLECLTILS